MVRIPTRDATLPGVGSLPSPTMKQILQKQTGKVLYRTHAATLRRAELSGVDFTGAEMPGEDLSGASLDGATLARADLTGANIRDARLKGAVLRDADLSGAALCGADLYGSFLRGARLNGADLSGARLDGADMRAAELDGAVIHDASFGNHLPDRADLLVALRHILHILCATPGYFFRRLLPITLPVVVVMAAFVLLRIVAFDFQYDRSRLPAGWPDFVPGLIGNALTLAAIVALGLMLRRIFARLGTRDAFEGYLGLLFFFVSGVYLVVAITGYMDDVARETITSTVFRVLKVFGFAVLVTLVMSVYGAPARMRPFEGEPVDPYALWRALGILTAASVLGLVLMNARMILAPFMGEYASFEDVDAFWRHLQLYLSVVAGLLLLWGTLPRLPFPATLSRSSLRGADLHGANLRGINFREADLRDADMGGAELRHADLRAAVLEGTNLEGAVFDATTRWPDGIDPEARGAVRHATPFWHVPITSLLLRRREF